MDHSLSIEPSERIGVQEGSTSKILDHPFFAAVDLTQLKAGTLAPEFVPEPQVRHFPPSSFIVNGIFPHLTCIFLPTICCSLFIVHCSFRWHSRIMNPFPP